MGVLTEAFAAADQAAGIGQSSREQTETLHTAIAKRLFADAEHWPMRRLQEVCENLDRQRVPITKRDRVPGDVPYYGASGQVDSVAEALFDEDLLLISEDGANLLARKYPIAFSISGPSWVNNHAHVLRFASPARQRYVEYWMNAYDLTPHVSGMAQPKLNQKQLNSIELPWPDDGEEVAGLVQKLDAATATSSALAAAYDRKLALLDELKASLLDAAFAGRL